jgi:hypothetical protein
MIILKYILYYLLLGVGFNFIWDLLISILKHGPYVKEEHRLENNERIFMCLVWPYGTFLILYHLYIALNKKNKDD